MTSSVASSLCECVSENEDYIPRVSDVPLSLHPSYIQTQGAESYGKDTFADTVSASLVRLGPVLVIRGDGDKLSYDPYGQCHTVRLIVSPPAGKDEANEAEINGALLSCKLPYVERFDVDISGVKPGHTIEFSSFIEKYRSTIRTVRVVCGSVLMDWETIAAGYGRVFGSLHLLPRLEGLTLILESATTYPLGLWTRFFVGDLPYLSNLIHLRLQAASFGLMDIAISAPALQTLVLEENVSDEGIISLASLRGLTRLCISSSRTLVLSKCNPRLQFLELRRVPFLAGDIKSVRVANFTSCPPELVAHVLSSTTSRGLNSLRHLGLSCIHAPCLYINATYLDVLFLSNVTVATICVKLKHLIEALYLHDVRLLTITSTLRVKHLALSASDHSICSYIAREGIQTAHLQSVALDFACEEYPVALMNFLRNAKDTLTLFACFHPRIQPPKMPHLKYMAATTVAGSLHLPGMLRERQLDVFACPKLEWEAVRASPDIYAVSKTQTTCSNVSQFWYANLGWETPLVHGGNGSWSFLLSQNVRKILQDDEAFVERVASNRVLESTSNTASLDSLPSRP